MELSEQVASLAADVLLLQLGIEERADALTDPQWGPTGPSAQVVEEEEAAAEDLCAQGSALEVETLNADQIFLLRAIEERADALAEPQWGPTDPWALPSPQLSPTASAAERSSQDARPVLQLLPRVPPLPAAHLLAAAAPLAAAPSGQVQ